MKLLKLWPIMVSIIFLCLNKEMIIMPFLKILKFSSISIFLIFGLWGSAELFWWFWFRNWIFHSIVSTQAVKDFLNNINKNSVKNNLIELLKIIWNFFIKKFQEENYYKFQFLKKFGRKTAIILTGMLPWLTEIGVILCANKWSDKMLFIIANLVKIAYFTGLWTLLWILISQAIN